MTEENLFLVDENDTPLSFTLPRSAVHKNLSHWHRASSVLLINERGELLCHQRSLTKDRAPGMWNHNFGGHVRFGESTLENALRELQEEVGLQCTAQDLVYVGKYFAPSVKHIDWIFALPYKKTYGEVLLSEDEVAQIRWFTLEELDAWTAAGKFMFPFYEVAREWLSRRNSDTHGSVVNG
jgi:isopentenyl-diphosphate delta-isomerase